MKTHPIAPAHISFDAAGQPFAEGFGDVYHPRAGALAQAEHVFLAGNGLPQRWAQHERFVILETGFGLGLNFLATWRAWQTWRASPAGQHSGTGCRRLHYLAVDLHPPTQADLQHALRVSLRQEEALAQGVLNGLADELVASWPALTCDIHRLVFEQGEIELLLAFGDAASWLRSLHAQVDAFYLDGFSPKRNPAMWGEALFRTLPRLAAPGATASTWSIARTVQQGLAAQGFAVHRVAGLAQKREMTLAHYTPSVHRRFGPRQPSQAHQAMADHPRADLPQAHLPQADPAPAHQPQPHRAQLSLAYTSGSTSADAVVIGAGIAGACAAAALLEQGLTVLVVDAASAVASGASGNPAGLFRSVVNGHDGAHARWHRASALEAWRQYAPLIRSGAVAGGLDGVLRLDDDPQAMQALATELGLPESHVRVLQSPMAPGAAQHLGNSHPQARSEGSGRSQHAAWLFQQAGWVAPVDLVRHFLNKPGIALKLACPVNHLRAPAQPGGRWQLIDASGGTLAQAPVVVVAAAQSCVKLLPQLQWPLAAARGQITQVPAALAAGLAPARPIASTGYALRLRNDDVLCGSTSHLNDEFAALRDDDHAHNLRVLLRLSGSALFEPTSNMAGSSKPHTTAMPRGAPKGGRGETGVARHAANPNELGRTLASLTGRVAWRSSMPDRLPLVGAVPQTPQVAAANVAANLLTQLKHWPRQPGLYVLAGLGSRGLACAPLAARVLAAQIAGAPQPVDQSLLNAVDPARHWVRALRKANTSSARLG